jgi:hypothetical protein
LSIHWEGLYNGNAIDLPLGGVRFESREVFTPEMKVDGMKIHPENLSNGSAIDLSSGGVRFESRGVNPFY